jgi:uncharacterized membrane protein
MTVPGAGKSGLPPHVVAVLAYVGGVITGIVVLSVEKEDRFVRFHAMQSTVTFLIVLIAHLVLTGLPVIGKALYYPFVLGVAVLWVFLMVQAFNGHRYKLPYIGDFAERQLR